MSVHVLRAADRRPQPWKNGGGVTRDVIVHPPGAGFADFDWRVSIADVASNGPFSRFEGIDRVLTILSGTLDLAFDDGETVRLSPASAPYAFAGDVACHGHVIAAPVRDLNVMVRRGVASAQVARLASGRVPAGVRLLVFTAAGALIHAGAEHRLEPLDAVLVDRQSAIMAHSTGDIFAVSLT